MFYVVTYVLTTLATFGIILLLAREGFESEEITDLAGLNQRSPLYAGVMAVCLFSLAGIPPLVGFYAKLSVLQALVASGQAWPCVPARVHRLAVFAVMMSLMGATSITCAWSRSCTLTRRKPATALPSGPMPG
jgi:NADH-quinone oxidoreductase subunit N